MYESISGGAIDATAMRDTSLLAQGTAMRDALVGDLVRLDGVAVACVAGAATPLPAGLDRVGVVRPEHTPVAEFLACRAGEYDAVWVIAPETGGLLADLAAAIGPARWIGCSAAAIRLASSKSDTRTRLAAHGVPVPEAWQPGAALPHAGSLWVVKPDDGAGTEHTRLHRDFGSAREDLVARLALGQPSTLEAWVPGEALSLSLLCADGRADVLAINHQRIRAVPGEPVAYLGVEVRAEPVTGPRGAGLSTLAQRVADAIPGLAGYVGIDVVWNARRGPVVIEVNPRLTCAYAGLSSALGRNIAGEILDNMYLEAPADVTG